MSKHRPSTTGTAPSTVRKVREHRKPSVTVERLVALLPLAARS